ncbi:MAG: Tex family protein [Acidobacteriota bacterium]
MENDIAVLAEQCGIKILQAKNVTEMIKEGMSVPFISRYRKEKSGNLDEEKVNLVSEYYEFLTELNKRKETILKSIEGQDKLTEEIKEKIENIYSKNDLEDLYIPFKPKKRTKAVIAREMGLEPLAIKILDASESQKVEELAIRYVNAEKGVETIEKALEWAGFIIAEKFAEDERLRKYLRNAINNSGLLRVEVTKEYKGKRSKFEQYYNYSEKIKTIPSHRVLAIFRGHNEGVLKNKVDINNPEIFEKGKRYLYKEIHRRKYFLDTIYTDSIKRLVFPSIELEAKARLKKESDEEAVKVFASNLEKVLLSPPAGNINTLAIDPGFRTGCKVAALDNTGKLLTNTTIYPTKPEEDFEGSKKTILDLIRSFKLKIIAIGNGTASKETYTFIKQIVPENIKVSIVSEAGASVYSASKAGREEFPDHDVTVRGAVSIGRRFQDPLSELVKIEPKSIGVGQYQHDVNQVLLAKKLDLVVSSVVNRVGVDLNSASYHLLRYVSGIGEKLAKNIVEYRDREGLFKNREELKSINKLGSKAFIQSAGFLRINNGNNILDSTGIHPESYSIVEKMSLDLGVKPEILVNNEDMISKVVPENYTEENFGIYTIKDIINELKKPGRDPRKNFEVLEFESGIDSIDDLSAGMKLKGVVTNVTNFGAFVDIGVHQDGLVHISEMSHKFIKEPEKILATGDIIEVKVINIDTDLNRIQLSIKALTEKR